jgi:hypothetical protein
MTFMEIVLTGLSSRLALGLTSPLCTKGCCNPTLSQHGLFQMLRVSGLPLFVVIGECGKKCLALAKIQNSRLLDRNLLGQLTPGGVDAGIWQEFGCGPGRSCENLLRGWPIPSRYPMPVPFGVVCDISAATATSQQDPARVVVQLFLARNKNDSQHEFCTKIPEALFRTMVVLLLVVELTMSCGAFLVDNDDDNTDTARHASTLFR